MFSAIYLVCVLNQPCVFFVDPMPHPSLDVCQNEAELRIIDNQNKVAIGENLPHTAKYQCINWEDA